MRADEDDDPRSPDPKAAQAAWLAQVQQEEQGTPIAIQVDGAEEFMRKLMAISRQLDFYTYSDRQRGAFTLASLLSSSRESKELLASAEAHLTEQSPLPALLQLAAEAEGAADYDAVTVQLVLSCIANLSYVGMTLQMVNQQGLCQLVVRALLQGKENEAMMQFALPAAYNLSSESVMLQALEYGGASPVLTMISKLTNAEYEVLSRYARHILANIKKHRAQMLPAAGPSAAPAKRTGILGMFRRGSKRPVDQQYASSGASADAERASHVAESVQLKKKKFGFASRFRRKSSKENAPTLSIASPGTESRL